MSRFTLFTLLGIGICMTMVCGREGSSAHAEEIAKREIPRPLSHHPGNVFLEGENVRISLPISGLWSLCDAEDSIVKEFRTEGTSANLGNLPVGFYRLRNVEFNDWISLAVIAPLQAPTPDTSPIALDVAMSWFYPEEKMEDVANLCALAGVNWVRDRLSWAEVEPERGRFVENTKYDAAASAQAAAGLKVLQVFHSSPRWANPNGKRFPLDLRDVHEFLRHVAERWKGKVLAYEPWNEADIEVFGGHTGAEMASLQKASYWAIKAGNPNAIVCWNVFASDNPAQLSDVDANQAWPYFETFNFHHYRPLEQYPRFYNDFRAISAGRPLWVTECAMPLPWTGDPQKQELSDRDLFEQARRLVKVFAGSLHEGTAATFYFLLPNYVEGQTQFGIIRRDLTPRPAYLSLAAVGRLLANARPLGRLNADRCLAYAFHGEPDGNPRIVLVAWSQEPAILSLPGKPLEIYDYLGRQREVSQELTLTSSPVFVVLPKSTVDGLSLLEPPKTATMRPGQPCPVVLQSLWPTDRVDLKRSAYRVETLGEEIVVPIFAYNFADKPLTGRFIVTVPDGWTASFPDAGTLGPGERSQWDVCIKPGSFRGEEVATVRIEGDFSEAGKTVLSFRLAH
ncbi:MAG: hypothetical protein ACUVQG_08000 [Thermogutta sp.]